jgi:hypothetical protein
MIMHGKRPVPAYGIGRFPVLDHETPAAANRAEPPPLHHRILPAGQTGRSHHAHVPIVDNHLK